MRVHNIVNDRGNVTPNQFVIEDNNKTTFQSYDSEILTIEDDAQHIWVGKNYDYSRTTSKYLLQFCRDYYYCLFGNIHKRQDFLDKLTELSSRGWVVEFEGV